MNLQYIKPADIYTVVYHTFPHPTIDACFTIKHGKVNFELMLDGQNDYYYVQSFIN